MCSYFTIPESTFGDYTDNILFWTFGEKHFVKMTQYSEIENSEKTENYLTELTSSLSEKMYLFKMNHIQYKNNGGNFPIYLHYITDFQDFFQKVNYEII